jgi:choice-of-anchor C domain-containing protein
MFKQKKIWIVTLTLAVVISLPAYSAADETDNLLQNGSFETYSKDPSTWTFPGRVDLYLEVGNTNIANWTVINGMIDYFGLCPEDPPNLWYAADGDYSIELAASPSAGGVSQTFDTVAGETYRVQFCMSGSPMTGWSGEDQPNKTLRVQAAGQSRDFAFDVAAEQNSYTDMKWKLCTFFFVADSDTTTLEIFSTMEPVHIGPVIDDVSVVLASDWSPAGTYTGTNNVAEELLVTIIPLSPDSERFSIVRDALNQNPGFEGRPISRGEMAKVGPNEYAATVVAHITDNNLKLQWKAVVSGTFIQTGPDTLETNLTLTIYTPDQNPFAEGSMPVMSYPGVMDTLQRVPIVPAFIPPVAP